MPKPPLLAMTDVSNERLVTSIRGIREALDMFTPSPALHMVATKLIEAELWLSRTPIGPLLESVPVEEGEP